MGNWIEVSFLFCVGNCQKWRKTCEIYHVLIFWYTYATGKCNTSHVMEIHTWLRSWSSGILYLMCRIFLSTWTLSQPRSYQEIENGISSSTMSNKKTVRLLAHQLGQPRFKFWDLLSYIWLPVTSYCSYCHGDIKKYS